MKTTAKSIVLALFLLFALSSYTFAENEAVFDFSTFMLNIPKVVVAGENYELGMQLLLGTDPLLFELISLDPIQPSDDSDSLVGTWMLLQNNGSTIGPYGATDTLVFTEDQHFSHTKAETDDPNCNNGVESGIYKYNASGEKVIFGVTGSAIGDCGFGYYLSNYTSFTRVGDNMYIADLTLVKAE